MNKCNQLINEWKLTHYKYSSSLLSRRRWEFSCIVSALQTEFYGLVVNGGTHCICRALGSRVGGGGRRWIQRRVSYKSRCFHSQNCNSTRMNDCPQTLKLWVRQWGTRKERGEGAGDRVRVYRICQRPCYLFANQNIEMSPLAEECDQICTVRRTSTFKIILCWYRPKRP